MKGFAAALLLLLAAGQEQQPTRSTFRSTVDLVPVDVSVVDKNGRPVRDLTAADFSLLVDGKPRRIASAQFIAIESPIESAPPPREFTTNAGAAAGRLIMLVIDAENIGTGRGKPAIDAARRFIGGLNRADRVALVVLPGVGPQLEFTSNHALVQTMLNTVVGQGGSELVGPRKVGIAEALAIQRNDRMALQEAINRECGVDTSPPLLQSCISQLTGEADQLVTISRHRTRDSLLALRNLFERMTAGNTPKTIVLLSEGLLIDRDLTDVAWVAPRASAAHIILYVLQLDSPDMDASVQRLSPSRGADREVMRQGLDHLAGLARGDVFRVFGNADFAFQRLGLEMSGYYLLSFEPEAGDRDGKPHKIKIDIGRKDLYLRSRREFNVGPSEAMGTEEVLRETLRTPLLAPDIPLRLTTYTFQDPESSKLKILLATEIDRSTNADQKIALGYTLTDETGQVVSGAMEKVVRTPIERDRNVQKYVGAAIAAPGTYTLKVAVVDEIGKRGSVERTFNARINGFGQLRATDLLIADNSARGMAGLPPAVAADFSGDQLHGYLELFSDAPEQLKNATVTIEVAENETGRALDSTPARFQQAQTGGDRRRAAEAGVPIGLLPPGEYVARAVISVGGRKVGQVVRPFRVTRAAPVVSAPGSGTVLMRSAAPIAFTSRIDAFDKASVLTPQVVGFFLDRMSAAAASSATTLAPALASVRAGRFEEAMGALKHASNDQLAAVFLAGLVLLHRGELEAARGKFSDALRLDSEFLPAAFYLGACYAAAGRDREAAGAWQTALITESNAPFVYTLLGDALLRLRDMDQALDVLSEARALWPADAAVTVRLGTALVLANKPADALNILQPYLDANPGDHERLFLALRALYETRSAGRAIGTPESDKALFLRYAAAYAAANGTQQALVDQWRKYIEK